MPVQSERATLKKAADDHTDERHAHEYVCGLDRSSIRLHLASDLFQPDEDTNFHAPEKPCIADPPGEDHLRAKYTSLHLVWMHALECVHLADEMHAEVDEGGICAGEAGEEWDDGEGHPEVFGEKGLTAAVAPG